MKDQWKFTAYKERELKKTERELDKALESYKKIRTKVIQKQEKLVYLKALTLAEYRIEKQQIKIEL